MDMAERIFYRNKLQDNRNDFKAIYCICNGLLGRTRDLPLPPCESKQELADRFANFFSSKIKKIHSILDETNKSLVEEGLQVPSEKQTDHRLECFTHVSENVVTSLINKSPNKACELDPIPTDLLKQVLEETTPVIQSIINKSLQQGVFPDDMKEAFLRPLLKSPKLELQDQNHRPLSNLSFCSKTIERVAANQIVYYIEKNNLMEQNQSAYRRNHSTETTLLKVKSDILLAMDKQHITCLCLLDLSAAYDTIQLSTLLTRLEKRFGITGTALSWIHSYVTNRTQKVIIGDLYQDGVMSQSVSLTSGIPQGISIHIHDIIWCFSLCLISCNSAIFS